MTSKKKSPESLPGDSGQDNRSENLAGSERADSSAARNKREGSPSLLDGALAYAAKGIPVFPLNDKKAPRVEGGFHAATKDAGLIRRWWTRWPNALIGVPTGAPSGIAVLDIDLKPEKNKNGFPFVPDWKTRSTVIARTGLGITHGAHLYFRHPGALSSTSDKLAHGVDTRGDGGYVIVPPSPGYEWITSDTLPSFNLANLPPWPRDMLLPERVVTYGTELQAEDYDDVAAALAVIPNDDVGWDEWSNMGLAVHAATEGEGFELFDEWSQKSGKYDPVVTQAKWARIVRSPGNNIGAGTIFYKANEAQPNWRSDHAAKLASILSAVDANDFISEMLGRTPSHAVTSGLSVNQAGAALRDTTSLDERDGAFSNAVEPPPPVDNPEPSPAPTSPDPAPPAVAKDVSGNQAEPKPRLNGRNPLLKTNAEFLSGFVPPDYLIYGLVQRGFLYSMTAPTGTGKTAVLLLLAAMVAQGKKLGDRDVEPGKVLFLAGENPDDVRMRWIKQAELMNFDHDKIDVVWRDGTMDLVRDRPSAARYNPNPVQEVHPDFIQEANILGPLALVIVDTSAAFFKGDDENNNPKLGNYVRLLRSLTKLNGAPTVIVSCHPTKNANMESLIPRGGGSYLAEVDGNFACRRVQGNGNVVEVITHGKFRGPEFPPISFSINAGTSDRLKDSKGRPIWTVTAQLMTDAERAKVDDSGRRREEDLLAAMADNPGASLATLALKAGWLGKNGEPNKSLATRVMGDLCLKKLTKKGAGDHYELTNIGKAEAKRVKDERDRM